MITNLFLLQLLLTLIVGTLWIFLTVMATSHFGSKIGGFIGGLPSTALLSFFFIGLTQSAEMASKATTAFPLVYAVTGLFLVVFASLVRRGFLIALGTALSIWFVLSALIVWINPNNFAIIIGIYLFIFIAAFYLLEKVIKVRSGNTTKVNYTTRQTAARSCFGGLIIMLAVLFTKLGGPVFGIQRTFHRHG